MIPICRARGTTGRSRRSSGHASSAHASSTPKKRRRRSRAAPVAVWTGRPKRFARDSTHAQYATDPGRFIADGNRTSLIVDPPDGRIPSLTAEGKARQARAPNRNNAVNASWLDRGNQERCITYGLPSASLPTLYNNNIQIVQAPGTAVIIHEMIHEARIVPARRPSAAERQRPGLDRRLARLVGRRHARGRDHELQRQEQLPRVDDRSAPDRTLHARR